VRVKDRVDRAVHAVEHAHRLFVHRLVPVPARVEQSGDLLHGGGELLGVGVPAGHEVGERGGGLTRPRAAENLGRTPDRGQVLVDVVVRGSDIPRRLVQR